MDDGSAGKAVNMGKGEGKRMTADAGLLLH